MVIFSDCPSLSENLNFIPAKLLWELSQKREAKITITPLIKKIKWQYPGEPQQELEASDYSLSFVKKDTTLYLKKYYVTATAFVFGDCPAWNKLDGELINIRSNSNFAFVEKVTNVFVASVSSSWRVYANSYSLNNPNCPQLLQNIALVWQDPQGSYRGLSSNKSTVSTVGVRDIHNITVVEDFSKAPATCRQYRDEYTFKIFKCNEEILEEIREIAPTILLENCNSNLEKKETINITLNPFDILYISKGKNNIIGTLIETFLNLLINALNNLSFEASFLNALNEININNPPECSLIFVLRNLSNIEIIKQTCSTCTCDPPSVEIECISNNCDYGDCKVDCGNYYCCYSPNGIAVKVISK